AVFQPSQTPGPPLTGANDAVGTLPYMSPEQLRGEAVDARSDVFSVGAVLYEMATGRPAFEGTAPAVVAEAILNGQPPLVTELRPELPASLAFVIDKALEKDRSLRYQNARSVRADLVRVRNELIPSANVRSRRHDVPSPGHLPRLMQFAIA